MKTKIKNPEEQAIKCLLFCVSKDETRPQLTGVYHDSELKNAVAINGFCGMVSRYLFNSDFSGLIVKDNFTTIKRNFPKYEQFLDFKDYKEFTLDLDKKDIQFKKKGVTDIYMQVGNENKLMLSYEKPTHENYILIDAYMFSCLFGREYIVKLRFNNNVLDSRSPVHIELFRDENYFFMPKRKWKTR